MVYHHHTCCNAKFKECIKNKHRDCQKTKPTKLVLGKKRYAFYGIGLSDDIKYRVYHNIYQNLGHYTIPRQVKEKDIIIIPTDQARFSRQLNTGKMDTNKMKKVTIRVGTKEYTVIDSIEEEITNKKSIQIMISSTVK